MPSLAALALVLAACGTTPGASVSPASAQSPTDKGAALPEWTMGAGGPGAPAPSMPGPAASAQARENPWQVAVRDLASRVPADVAADLEARERARSVARTAEADVLFAARHRLVGAVLGHPDDAETRAALADVRRLVEDSLRKERAFAWGFLAAAGTEGRAFLAGGDRVAELLTSPYTSMLEGARVQIPHDVEGDLSAAASLGAVRYRLAAAAQPVDAAHDALRAALRGLDPGDAARRDEAERRMKALDAALLDFCVAKVAQLAWLRADLGGARWNALARTWNVADAVKGLGPESAPTRADSVTAQLLGAGSDAASSDTRRAWEIGGASAGGMGGGTPGSAPAAPPSR